MVEIWRSVPGWEQYYEVSNMGRVRSLGRVSVHRSRKRPGACYAQHRNGRVLRAAPGTDGYRFVTLAAERVKARRSIHSLVAEAFLGPKSGDLVRHIDGDPGNNAAHNLAWGTYAENEADKVRHGTAAKCERNGMAKLTFETACEVRRLHGAGVSQKALANQFGVNRKCVWLIVHNRAYRDDRLALAECVRALAGVARG